MARDGLIVCLLLCLLPSCEVVEAAQNAKETSRQLIEQIKHHEVASERLTKATDSIVDLADTLGKWATGVLVPFATLVLGLIVRALNPAAKEAAKP